MTRSALPDLETAIAWLRDAIEPGPPVPLRLHGRDVEPDSVLGSPDARPLMRWITSSPSELVTATEEVPCFHSTIADDRERLRASSCDHCTAGRRRVERTVRRYPFWHAFAGLAYRDPFAKGYPLPNRVILALLLVGLDVERVSIPDPAAPGCYVDAETRAAVVLRAIRQLHSRYEITPIPRPTPDLQEVTNG